MTHTLWLTPNAERFFLIPQDQALAAGTTRIQTLDEKQQSVDETALAAFEITREQAEEHTKNQLNQAMYQAKTAFSDLIAFARLLDKQQKETPSLEADPDETWQPGLDFLSTFLSAFSNKKPEDPEDAQEILLHFLTNFQEMIESTTNGDSASIELTRNYIYDLRHTLQQYGIELDESVADLPEQVHGLRYAGETQNQDDFAAILRDIATQVELATEESGQRVDETIARLQQQFGIDNEARWTRERQERASQAAQSAIAASLRAHGIEPSSDKQKSKDKKKRKSRKKK